MSDRPIIFQDGRIEADTWYHLDEVTLAEDPSNATVPLGRFLESETSFGGVRLPNTAPVDSLMGKLDDVKLVTIDFPRFTDGRGYTLARDLRVRLNYTGELRAVGDITRDQLLYLSRCGFDAYVLKEGKNPHDALKAFQEQSIRYQPELELAV